MSDSERATDATATGVRSRLRRPLLLVGVATAVVVGAALLLVPRGSAASSGSVVTLTAGGDASAQCAPLDAFAVESLRRSDLAFSGTVTTASSGTVEIVPDRVWRGPATRLVRLRTDSGGGPALDGPDLLRGDRVLVSAGDGQVAGCGLSAADSPELHRYYDVAFG